MYFKFLAFKWFSRDLALRYGVKLMGGVFMMLYFLLHLFSKNIAYRCLLKASRYSHSNIASKEIARNLNDMTPVIDELLKTENAKYMRYPVERSIVLKNPALLDGNIVSKGILLIKFTDTFAYFCTETNNNELLKYFNIILEPSWAGYALPEILYWSRLNGGKVLIESSEIKDFELIAGLNSILRPVSFGSSDWVDFRVFKPLGLDKIYDSIYVANFNFIKRHHVYFKALKTLKGTGYRAALVCGRWGDNKNEIEALINHYGIKDMLDIHIGLSQAELNTLLNQSKVNLLMSLKEGSNRSIFEGLFAGVPGIILNNNIGVNKTYINQFTGMQIDEKDLSDALLHFKEKWTDYDCNAWVTKNISPIETTKNMLKAFSDDNAVSDKECKNTAVKVNIPEARYINKSDSVFFLTSKQVVNVFSNKNETEQYYYNCIVNELNSIKSAIK